MLIAALTLSYRFLEILDELSLGEILMKFFLLFSLEFSVLLLEYSIGGGFPLIV